MFVLEILLGSLSIILVVQMDLVLEILLGSLSIILVVQMDLKVKGSLLWAAYALMDSHSLTTVVKVSTSCHN